MAYLACIYAESIVSERLRVTNRKLRIRAVYHRRYAEDLVRMKDLWILKALAISPIEMLVRHGHNSYVGDSTHEMQEIMGKVSEYRPQDDIIHPWETATGLPWDPIDCCAVHTQRELVCPKCGALVVARSVACRLNSAAWFSTFLVHSLPYAREDRFSTGSFHLRLWHM